MKTYNTPYGIFYNRPFLSQNHIEEIAVQALEKAGCADFEPGEIPIEDVLEECLGIAVEYSELPEDVMGCATFQPEGVTRIEIHTRLALSGDDLTLDRRRRSTIAHELGHGLIHTPLYQQRFAIERLQSHFEPSEPQLAQIACRSSTIREDTLQPESANSYSWIEWQANAMMGPLLIPRCALGRHLEPWVGRADGVRILQLPSSARTEAEQSVSEVFHVSRQLAAIRIAMLFPEASTDQPDLFAEVSA